MTNLNAGGDGAELRAAAPAEAKRRSTASLVRSGIAWGATVRVVQVLALLAANALLARLLSPVDFGVVNMSSIFLSVANGLADFGVRSYVIQKRNLTDRECLGAQLLSCLAGGVVMATGIAAAYPLARFYREPHLLPVLVVQAITYMVLNLSSVRTAILAREMDYRRLALAEITGTLAYSAVASGLAFVGASYWSLVIGRIAQSVGSLAALHSRGWRWIPRGASIRDVRGVFQFGGAVTLTGILGQLDENFDNIVVGRTLGSGPLGLYAVSYNVAALPQKYLAFMISGIAYPALARMRNTEFRLGCLRFVKYQVLGPAAVAVGMSVLAPEVCRLLLGERWPEAPGLVRIMALSSAGLSVATTVGGILLSRGLAKSVLAFQSVKLAVTVGGVLTGIAWGLRGVAIGFAIATAINLAIGLMYASHKTGQGAWALLLAASRPIIGVVLAAEISNNVRAIVDIKGDVNPILLAITCGFVFAAALLTWVALMQPEEWRELLQGVGLGTRRRR